jgi:hypothetical protein
VSEIWSITVLKECHDPAMLPVDEVRIDPVTVNNIGLGKIFYTREQLEEFARFQDSQGTRKAYLAETAEMAYIGRNEKGEWGAGSGLSGAGVPDRPRGSELLPPVQGGGPHGVLPLTPPLGVGRASASVTVFLRVAIIVRYKDAGYGC